MSNANDPTAIMNQAQQKINEERAAKAEPTDLLHVFHATLPSINYIFPNGKPAIFVSGRFTTNIPYEFEHLDYEIKMGHPHIFKKKGEETMEAKYLDPMVGLREKIIADAVASGLVAYGDPNKDMGTSVQTKLNVASSRDIAQAASGGSGETGARLAALTSLGGANKASVPPQLIPGLGGLGEKK